MSPPYILVGLLICFCVIFLAVAIAQTWLHLRLKSRHHDVWRSLGEPMPLINLGLHNHTYTLRFLRLREYEHIPDPGTRRLASVLRVLNSIFLCYIFGASAMVFLIVAFDKFGRA